MAATNLEDRIKTLEGLFSSETSTGLCPYLEKKLNVVINQRLGELESRTIALADSKVDAADCYLRLKNKVERADFQKMMDRFLEVKQGFDELKTSHLDTKAAQDEMYAKCKEETQKMQTRIVDFQRESQEQYQELMTDLLTKGITPQKKPAVDPQILEDIRLALERTAKAESRLNEIDKRFPGLDDDLNSTKDSITKTNEAVGKAAEEVKKIWGKLQEQTNRFPGIKTEFAELRGVMDTYARNVREIEQKMEKSVETVADIEGALDQVRKRHGILETKQASLATELATRSVGDRGGITATMMMGKGEEKRYLEAAEDVREKAATMIRENVVIRREFDDIRGSLEGEIVRLRSENELIMKEYERMYEHNRETEARITKLHDDCKLFVLEQRKKVACPDITFYSSGPRRPGVEKQISLINTNEAITFPHRQPEESAKHVASNRINIRTRKLRDGAVALSGTADYLNKSSVDRTPPDIGTPAGEMPRTATGKRSKTTALYPKSGGGEKLNRFKVWME